MEDGINMDGKRESEARKNNEGKTEREEEEIKKEEGKTELEE
jgi:hypothetical protein